jgi:FkbM family methyltransferase
MYLLREGSYNSNDKQFLQLEKPSKNYKDAQLMFFPDDYKTAKWFYESGMAEKPLIMWATDNMIKDTHNFLDIGAHVGTYAWTCGKKANHTYAFECSPSTFCYLAANVALQGLEDKISVYPYALGNADKEVEYIIRSQDGGGNGVKSLSDADTSCKKVKVQMKTLDSFKLSNIGFIKIDVEGFEKEVLEGGVETLKNNNYPPILFESWGDWKEREGVPATKIREELFEYLKNLGYKVNIVHGVIDMYLAKHE